MRIAAALALSLALSGCALIPGTTVRQNVPIPVPCDVPDIPTPSVPIDSMPAQPDVFVTGRALWATVETLEGHAAQMRAALDACRSK